MNAKSGIFLLLFSTLSWQVQASPFQFFNRACNSLMNMLGRQKADFHGAQYVAPQNSHPSHLSLLENLKQVDEPATRHYHLPYVEQSLEEFPATGRSYIRYYFDGAANNSQGRREFIENTIEIIYTPHASYHGHVRLRLGDKLYGYENVKRIFNSKFDGSFLYKSERKLKRGRKEGNIGVVYTLTPEQKQVLESRKEMINTFYDSSERYNIPPFDGSGSTEVKVLVDESTGKITYRSPTSRSNHGNHGEASGKIVEVDGQEFLEAPNGYRHPISRNANGERITRAYSCASSVHHILFEALGIQVKEMPYAGSFMTHLKNGAEEHLSPDSIIHYYPSSDL